MHVLVIPRGDFAVSSLRLSGLPERDQVLALSSAGFDVGVLSVGAISMRYAHKNVDYSRRAILGSVPVFRSYRRGYWPSRWVSTRQRTARNFRLIEPLFDAYVEENGLPNVIHAHNLLYGGQLARPLAELSGIPYIVTEHFGVFIHQDRVRASAQDLLGVAADASRILAVSRRVKSAIESGLADDSIAEVSVVPNVLPDEVLTNSLAPRVAKPFTVLGIGNLLPQKDYALLIRAFAAARLPPEARLVIGGTGPEMRRLRRLGDRLGLDDRLVMLGYLTREEVFAAMRSADVFAHPSRGESFGVVVIEALATGLPVVVTACGGPEDIVQPSDGLLVGVGDEQSFSQALEEMYAERLKFEGEDLHRRCVERYGAPEFVRAMRSIYTQVAARQ